MRATDEMCEMGGIRAARSVAVKVTSRMRPWFAVYGLDNRCAASRVTPRPQYSVHRTIRGLEELESKEIRHPGW